MRSPGTARATSTRTDGRRRHRERAPSEAARVYSRPQRPPLLLGAATTPEALAAAAGAVRPEDLKGKLRVSSDLKRHIDWVRGDLELGFDAVYLFTIDGNPERFIDVFGEKVLPACAGRG